MKIDALDFAVYALAVWRLASLFANESGPFDILLRFRAKVGVKFDASGKYATRAFPKGLICVWCSSLWYATVIVALAHFFPDVTFAACAVLALSTIAVIIEETVNKLME
jgi:hypothetical protein